MAPLEDDHLNFPGFALVASVSYHTCHLLRQHAYRQLQSESGSPRANDRRRMKSRDGVKTEWLGWVCRRYRCQQWAKVFLRPSDEWQRWRIHCKIRAAVQASDAPVDR